MAKILRSVSALWIITALAAAPAFAAGGSASGGSGGSSSPGSAASAGGVGPSTPSSAGVSTSSSAGPLAGTATGSTPAPGKRHAVEGALQRTGNAPTQAEDKQELQSLNQISHQIAPSVPVPAPEAGH